MALDHVQGAEGLVVHLQRAEGLVVHRLVALGGEHYCRAHAPHTRGTPPRHFPPERTSLHRCRAVVLVFLFVDCRAVLAEKKIFVDCVPAAEEKMRTLRGRRAETGP